jgi:transcriptional regulator NrdR family protein
MLCTGCKYPYSDVVKTRHDGSRSLTIRRRECLRCGLRFTTHEQLKESRPNDDRFQLGNVK